MNTLLSHIFAVKHFVCSVKDSSIHGRGFLLGFLLLLWFAIVVLMEILVMIMQKLLKSNNDLILAVITFDLHLMDGL